MKTIDGNELLKKWFHSLKGEGMEWQGQVIGKINEVYYLVQLYSWADGRPTIQRLIKVWDMERWQFYSTDREMKDWSENHKHLKQV